MLLFSPERLNAIARRSGGLQIVYAGKAHPQDPTGKAIIPRIFEVSRQLDPAVRVVYLENYNAALARYLVSGVDLWLNTPMRPQEASGTSGMKAALNGVPSLSVLDGWWIEGHVEGVTGWSIDDGPELPEGMAFEKVSLYNKLENVILPLFREKPAAYLEVRRSAIALNGSFFNTQRMVRQYLTNAYAPVRAETVETPGQQGGTRQEA
jgi:starch phosphorylase